MPFVARGNAAPSPKSAVVEDEQIVHVQVPEDTPSSPPNPSSPHHCPTCNAPLKTPLQKRMHKCKVIEAPIVAQECAVCESRGGKLCRLIPCEHCNSVMYCGREHKFAHWNTHRKSCKQLKEQTGAAAQAAPSTSSGPGCAVCGTHKDLTRCARCKVVLYCSRAHQQQHWQEHKPQCKASSAAKQPPIEEAPPGSPQFMSAAAALNEILGECNEFALKLHHQQQPADKQRLKQLLARATAAGAVTGLQHPLPYFLQGLLLKFLEQPAQALPRMEVAVMHPALPDEYKLVAMDMVVMLLEETDSTDAAKSLAVLERAVNAEPGNAHRVHMCGTQLERLGRYPEATERYSAAISLKPTETQFYRRAEACLATQDRIDECRELARLATGVQGLNYWKDPLQRPQHMVAGLQAAPWWTSEQFPLVRDLEEHYEEIKRELFGMSDVGVQMWSQVGGRAAHDASLVGAGSWNEIVIMGDSEAAEANRELCPVTARILESHKAVSELTRLRAGESLFSCLTPGTRLKPHCGPTNARLTCHLGLVIPPDVTIRVANETRTWEEGKCIVFDDSFEHEVIHDGGRNRFVLMINFFHPEIPESDYAEVAKAKA